MPKFAHFDPSTGDILNWMDTDAFSYPAMPDASTLAPATDGQWEERETAAFIIVNGQLSVPNAAVQLAAARAAQLEILNDGCKAAIYAGFTSSALGTAHAYPALDTDQQNLSASVLASLMPNLPSGWTTPFWCCDSSGAWSYAPHTAAQIQQVGQDGKAAILAAIAKKAQLAAQVNAATTIAAVQAIVWE
ncbi:hypothetical protein WT88_29650 [Burkholderia stagnalis]|uniref:DUF4376 domain-containing protein n=1 Tax=Burkholderia stagnalis TaxID=1503054 RepID=UPI00075B0995|nr:hypothetical protein [Burkholderia stagnalis]KVZ18647.1 hypothetical protein WT35_04590 [Burkholderia stagnalis]KWN32870.1 hypothetical protein WT86_18715 [Burkholderia stagnalis]KWN44697.1 hypothetical protein WT88_29650 [Burkholderia stagnalis]KWN54430.1 hypothetical protein WT87_03745 [Burkholderia stagnalis]KWO68837.1 hypothetical protein WT99_21115 [Burkholderia stagnalis]